jgi:LacI family transcriptional regulator
MTIRSKSEHRKQNASITIRDVAQRAGVSQATAARALGSYGRINAQTRDRVLAAAEALDYHTNALARSMVTGTTHTLGVVLADIENLFFARVARAVADVARQHGYTLLLANSDEDLEREQEAVRVLAQKRVDGLIVVPASSMEGAHLAPLLERHIPVVLLDRSIGGLETDTIMVDNFAAAHRAIQHLTALGHRRIGLVTASTTIATSAARIAGYRQALADIGITTPNQWIRVTEDSVASAQVEIAELLALPDADRPTAIFATDSILTAGAFRAMQAAGFTVPDDISLIGFDDVDWMSMVRPPVTVVNQPVYELGKRAAERLMARIEGDDSPPQQVWLETELIVRHSCTPPPIHPTTATARIC